MTTITIFGNGNLGQALDAALSRGGATVKHITTEERDVAVDGDLVILAVPYSSLDAVVEAYGEQLAGKVVVDVSNPASFDDFSSTLPAGATSAAEELQKALPQARVLKAFNTNFGGTLAAGAVAGLQVKVLVAGDDADAKQQLIAAVDAAGLRGIDAGGLDRAHALEQIGIQQIILAATEKTSWVGGFALAD